MIKDQRIRSGIAIYNILQFHLILYRQLFNVLLFPVCFRIIADAFIPDLLLQVVAHSHKERFKVGNGCEIVVDPVCTGDQPHGHYGKRCNIQDCAVIHNLCTLGDDVSVGHGAIVHGATVGDRVGLMTMPSALP